MNNLYNNNNIANLDAAQTIFFLNELNQLDKTLYERELPILKANELIPVDNSVDKGAESITYHMYDRTNNGKIISNYADDLPTVEDFATTATSYIRSYGDSFIISIQDLNAARFASKDIFANKAFAALESHMTWMNNLAFFGAPDANITGWLNNPYIPTAPVAGDTDPHKLWAYKVTVDPALIVADLNEIARATVLTSEGLYRADTIVMPLEQYNLIEGLRMGTGTDTTVLEFFSKNNRGITLAWANELKGAFSGKDGMIAYRKRKDDIRQVIPQAFEMLAPQWKNLSYLVPCHSRHGGTIIARPQTQVIRTGI